MYRYSQFQDAYSVDQILNSPKVTGHLTKLQCCPTSDGSAAAILASEDFVIQHGLQDQAVEILAMEMTTDFRSTFDDESPMKIVSHRTILLKEWQCQFCVKYGIMKALMKDIITKL